ncbi:MAG TPA: hypothetical protein VNW90_27140 [Acetobacteraceae bacterium]|jgi:hypothetical protein|nr:hypothetical protein [Acetobacteraceae bacterium]
MANRVSATLRLVAFFGLAAAILTGSLAGPAYADDQDNRNRQWNGSRQEHAHQQVHQQEHWQEQHRYQEYYRQPNVYYSAPPVVYQPPGATIYLSVPYFYN